MSAPDVSFVETGSPSPLGVVAALRRGECSDDEFDRFMASAERDASPRYWTPLEVVRLAVQWLEEVGVGVVLDIGSGCGKFCVAGAIMSRARFVGLEHRSGLVAAARHLARRFGVDDRVTFLEGTLGRTPLPAADAYYLFNPFAENYYALPSCLDQTVELSVDRYGRDVAEAERVLHRAPIGTWLVTYNGFGGRVPASYDKVRVERETPSPLYLWRKERDAVPGSIESPVRHPTGVGTLLRG